MMRLAARRLQVLAQVRRLRHGAETRLPLALDGGTRVREPADAELRLGMQDRRDEESNEKKDGTSGHPGTI
jgi:hypothetical protein